MSTPSWMASWTRSSRHISRRSGPLRPPDARRDRPAHRPPKPDFGSGRYHDMEDLNQVLRVRREKLQALRQAGIEPFAYGYERSHPSAEARALFEAAEGAAELSDTRDGPRVAVGGRIVGWRGHGKSAFAHIEDGAGRIQTYLKKDVLGDERFERLDLLDLGDWIGVEGPTFRTRTGEVTVRAETWTLLTKSLRPLPFGKVETDPDMGERITHSGFADQEARYRQRYADLAV